MIKLSLEKSYNEIFNEYDEIFNKIESKRIRYRCHLIHRHYKDNKREVIFYSKSNIITNNPNKFRIHKLKYPKQKNIEAKKDINWQLVSKYAD